jgi:DNA-directed RNA polymerase subunit RPC12/RpoP
MDRFKSSRITRMCDGITCRDGWYELIDDACNQIELIGKQFKVVVTFFQVKEKFAALRIYRGSTRYSPKLSGKRIIIIGKLIHSILHYAMCQSHIVCEECGKEGSKKRQLHSYLYNRCDECWKKLLQEVKKENQEYKKKLKRQKLCQQLKK